MIRDRPEKPNQDRALIVPLGDVGMAVYGAFDGHGELGHEVAEFVVQQLPNALLRQSHLLDGTTSLTQVTDGLVAAVCDINERLASERSDLNCVFSGSTAVFALHRGNQLFVANAGDSRAILCREPAGEPVPGKGRFEVVPLSTDHKPECECERQRILAAGGRVATIDGPPDEDNGPMRIWLANANVPGLALSRVVAGDLCARSIGVSIEPEVLQHDLDPRDAFAVFASDGVWEFLTNDQVATLLWTHRHNPAKAAKAIIRAATDQWHANEDGVVDDITCVLVQLKTSMD